MQRRLLKKLTIFIFCLFLISPITQATTSISNEDLSTSIQEVNNVRRQFMALSKQGFLNHSKEISNEDVIKLTTLYMNQISTIRASIEKFKSSDLDKFSSRKLETLLATTLYLKSMGENLIDYLSEPNIDNQYKFFTINSNFNDFILGILTDLQVAEY